MFFGVLKPFCSKDFTFITDIVEHDTHGSWTHQVALHPVSIKKAHNFEIAPRFNDRKEWVLIDASIRVNSLFQTFEILILLSSESFETRKLLPLLKELLLVINIEMSPDILFKQNGLVVEEQISFLKLSLRLVKVVYPGGN